MYRTEIMKESKQFFSVQFSWFFKPSNTGAKFLLETKTGKVPFWYGNPQIAACFIEPLEHIRT